MLCPADLDDTKALLVYGDWLQERGDPRGKLIAVQHALARGPTARLKEEARQRQRGRQLSLPLGLVK